jgi:hypothetical protein
LRTFAAWVLIALVTASCPAAAVDLPPDSLIRENCQKSQAIIQGRIVSSESKPNQFTKTRFRVSTVYVGPFHPGDELIYYSFREIGARSQRDFDHDMIVFLASRTEANGAVNWGTATDFAEFPSSSALESQVRKYAPRKQP